MRSGDCLVVVCVTNDSLDGIVGQSWCGRWRLRRDVNGVQSHFQFCGVYIRIDSRT